MSSSHVQRTPVNGSEESCADITVRSLFLNLGIDANRSTEMESINLSYKYLTEKEVRVLGRGLADAKSLSTVKLGSNLLGDRGAIAISSYLYENHTITCLDLGFNKIGDAGVEALADALCVNSSITTLYLSGNEITGAGLAHLERALTHNRALKVIYLDGNDTGVEGAKHLANAVKNNNSLTTLHINGNKFGADGMRVFSSALVGLDASSHLNLTNLHLSDNNMGDLGVTALSESLQAYKILKLLDLSFNNITHIGTNLLAQSLVGYSTLETLQLDNNSIKDQGAKYLAAILPTMPRLSNLNVGFNSIGTDGIQDILNASSVPMFRLESLALSGNSINDTTSMRIASRLTTDCVLKELYLDHINIGQTGERNITNGIISNAANTALRRLRGFALGSVLAKMSQQYEGWTELGNDQVLRRLVTMHSPQPLMSTQSSSSSISPPLQSQPGLSTSTPCSSSSSIQSFPVKDNNTNILHNAMQLMQNSSSYGYNSVTEKGNVIQVEAFPSSCIVRQGSSKFPHAVPLSASNGDPQMHPTVAEIVPGDNRGVKDGVFKQEIISIMDVNVSSSFTLSEEDIAMLLSDNDPSGMPSTQGMRSHDGSQYNSASPEILSSIVASTINNISYAPILRSIREFVSLPFESAELKKLDNYYMAKNETRSLDDLEVRSHCSGISTPDSCYEAEDSTSNSGHNRRGSRKRSTFDRESEEMESKSTSGNGGNGYSTNNSSSDDFGGVKKAANGISLSRISQYPRLRCLLEELKRKSKHEDLLILLRQLRYLEQYEHSQNQSGDEDSGSNSAERTKGKNLLPLEIETMILTIYEERV